MSDDREQISALRARFIAADRSGDADAMLGVLADDVAILHPQCGVIEGKEAAGTFMRAVLDDVHHQYQKHTSFAIVELEVSGTLAYERGTFAQHLTPKTGGSPIHEDGTYLWVYRRSERAGWQIARIAGTLTASDAGESGGDQC
jgi:ketosteroid isomerase-like protein